MNGAPLLGVMVLGQTITFWILCGCLAVEAWLLCSIGQFLIHEHQRENNNQKLVVHIDMTPNEELAVAINRTVDSEIQYRSKLRETDAALTAWLNAERELMRIQTEIKLKP